MKRVLLIGNSGSGKSTFAKALAKKTDLPLIHIDKIYLQDNWTNMDKDEFDKILQAELEKPEWIIDGNYNRTIPYRLKYCDTVFYLDFPVLTCFISATKRTIQNYGKTRDDVHSNCPEKFDKDKMLLYKNILGYNIKHRKKYYEMLNNAENVNVVIFKNRKEVNEYIREL